MSDIRVISTYIIGTDIRVFSAWVPSGIMGGHSSLQHFADGWRGRIGSERLPLDIDALKPMSYERIAAARVFFDQQYEVAYEAILAEHPWVAYGHRDNGEITVRDARS